MLVTSHRWRNACGKVTYSGKHMLLCFAYLHLLKHKVAADLLGNKSLFWKMCICSEMSKQWTLLGVSAATYCPKNSHVINLFTRIFCRQIYWLSINVNLVFWPTCTYMAAIFAVKTMHKHAQRNLLPNWWKWQTCIVRLCVSCFKSGFKSGLNIMYFLCFSESCLKILSLIVLLYVTERIILYYEIFATEIV